MSRVTPKTNWVSGNVPLGPDLNRMEGNAQQAFDELDANEAQRAIDEAALQANIDAEEARAIAAENAIQAEIDASLLGGQIGSLLFGTPNGVSDTYAYGSTISLGGSVTLITTGLNFSGDSFGGTVVSIGTWRCLGYCISTSYRYTLWIRVA